MKLTEILTPANIAVGLDARNALEVQRALVDLLRVDGARTRRAILESIRDREEIQTTGIGFGIAIPHGKADIDPDLLASVAITNEPIDYHAVDGEPVRIFILMVSRADATGAHIKALAHVARLLGRESFRQALISSGTPDAVLRLIRGEGVPEAGADLD